MIRTVVGFLGLLVLLPALQARDKPEKQTPAQQYQKLEKEHEKAQTDFRKALANAKTPEDRRKVIEEKNPNPINFASSFLELAEKNPKDPAAMDALIWIVTRIGGGAKSDPESPRSKAVKILLRDHVRSEKMATVCQSLGYAQDEESQQLLRAVLEKNKHRPAQAQACLALAQQVENRLRLARQFKEQPEMAKRYEAFMGKEAVESLVKAGPDKLSKEAEALYERAAKDFADVADASGGTVGKKANGRLEALRNPILVGKPAPEIEAEDIDGNKFKLSDYRGKVVMLDFWGHW
jgi:hypothetical protein